MKVFNAIAIAVLCLAVASAERTLLQATCGNGGKAANGNCNCAGGTVPAVDASNNFLCLNGQSQVVDNNNNPIFNCPSGGGGGGNGGGGGGGGGGGSGGGGVVANNGNNVNTNTNTNINNGNINNGNINSNNNNGNIFINTGSCNGPNACSVQRVTTGTLFARVSAGRHLLQACSPVSNVGSLPANTPLYSDASCTQQVGTATGNGQPIINPTNKGAFTPVGSPIPQDQIGKVSSPPAMAPGAAAQAPGAMAPKSGAASPPTGAVAPKSGAASPPTGASTSPMMSGSPMAMSGSPMSPKSGSPMTMSPTTMSPTTMSPMQTPGASAKPATSSPSGASPPPTATPMSTPAAANKPATSSPTANAANNASPSPAGRR